MALRATGSRLSAAAAPCLIRWPYPALRAFAATPANAPPVPASDAAPRPVATAPELFVGGNRHLGIVQMPQDMVTTIEEANRDGGSAKQVRLQAVELGKALRKKSRTAVRGGLVEHPMLDPETGLRQRALKRSDMRTKRLRELEGKSIEDIDAQGGEDAAYAMMKPKQRRAMDAELGSTSEAEFVPRYVEKSVAAYAANRLPSTYAAMYRILHELRAMVPGFTPSRVLDYGSGPGTAVWAMQEVWPGQLRDVLAVEPAEAMMSLGENLAHGRAEVAASAGHTPPNMRWMYKLPGFQGFVASGDSAKGGRQWRNMPRFDVVVASYVLTELESVKERRNLVKGLWELTEGMLILVEPGTPVGSANCREARTLILGQENKESGDGDGSRGGAHVVTPCPHDGKCPLDGTKDWCHFMQRHERPRMQQDAKGTPSRKRRRGYQDEKFSYVVLRRGPRSAPDVDYSALQSLMPTKAPRARQVPQLDWSRLDPAAKALLLDAAAGEDGDDGEEGEEVLEMRRRLMAELDGPEAGGRGDPRGGSFPGEMVLQGGGEETEEEAAPARSTVMQDGGEELAAAHQQVEEMEAEAEEEEEDEEGVEEEEDVMDMVDPAVLESVRQDHQLWGRILRPPKKRRRHVIMQVCMPCTGGSVEGSRQEITVSKSFDKQFPSHGPYFAARRANWGDAWAALYRKRAR